MKRLLVSFLAVLALFAFGEAPAMAGPISTGSVLGGTVVATGGEVNVYFLGKEASYTSLLWLDQPATVGPVFNNQTTAIGTVFNLGSFPADAVLSFRLQVLDTGIDYHTGPTNANPDQLAHAFVTPWVADATIPHDGFLVGFEDILGGGDRDYDDHQFMVTGATVTHTPEPATFLLLGSALLSLGVLRKYRTN